MDERTDEKRNPRGYTQQWQDITNRQILENHNQRTVKTIIHSVLLFVVALLTFDRSSSRFCGILREMDERDTIIITVMMTLLLLR